jgi:hypothetical protein
MLGYRCTGNCRHPSPRIPEARPAARLVDTIATFSARERNWLAARDEEYTCEIAAHEAGHVIGAALFGRATVYAQVGARPHVCYERHFCSRTEAALIVATLAGPVAGGYARHCIVCRTPEQMAYHFDKAEAGANGTCDDCHVAGLLLALYPDESRASLSRRWRAHWDVTADLFDRFEIRIQTGKLARALREHIHLDRTAIDALVDRAMLRAVGRDAVAATPGGEGADPT